MSFVFEDKDLLWAQFWQQELISFKESDIHINRNSRLKIIRLVNSYPNTTAAYPNTTAADKNDQAGSDGT